MIGGLVPFPRLTSLEDLHLHALTCRFRADRRPRKPRDARLYRERKIEGIPWAVYVRSRRSFVFVPNVIADEGLGYSELHVRFEILVFVDVHLRDVSLVARLEDQEMQVS